MTFPDWLQRWQQTADDELLYTPQYSGARELPEAREDDPLTAASLRQMARERCPESEEEDAWMP